MSRKMPFAGSTWTPVRSHNWAPTFGLSRDRCFEPLAISAQTRLPVPGEHHVGGRRPPRLVSSDASPTLPEWAVTARCRRPSPAASGTAGQLSTISKGRKGTSTGRTPPPGLTHRPPPAGAGSVVNRCGGGWSAVADAPSAPLAQHPSGQVAASARSSDVTPFRELPHDLN